MNDVEYNRHYIWVSEDIWKYFYCIYGGFEIRRSNLSYNRNIDELYLNDVNDEDLSNKENNIIVESKYKTFNLILFHYTINYTYKIDPPKYFFVPHYTTIYELKKKIKNIFPFLSKYYLDEIHLFYLAQNMNINSFANYIKVNKNCKEMNFPGISLDLFDNCLTLELLEETYLKINEAISNLVLEIPFTPEKKIKIYLFKNPSMIKSKEEKTKKIDYSKPYYDKIEININEKDNDFIINDKLFLVKKYFYQKYFIDKINKCEKRDLNVHLKKIINNFKSEQINKMFEAEINELRNNIDLIFDKTYLADNIPNLYLNEFDNKEKVSIGKKRKRVRKEEISTNSDDDSEISWYSCGFCNQAVNQNCVVCRFCLRKKYCNEKCRKNDIKNHLVSCGK